MPEVPTLSKIAKRWEPEILRLTSFLKPDADVGGRESWWLSVVGEGPEQTESRPRTGFIQQSGLFGGKRLSMVIQPGRVDWTFAEPIDSPDELGERLPTMGIFDEAYDRFSEIPKSWFDICPEISRIAFGAILDIPVSNRIEGYQLISQFLPTVSIDAEKSIDFLYQINRPRMSDNIDNLLLNRLAKWAVVRTGLVRFRVNVDGPTLSANLPHQFACRLELDINTAAEFSGEFHRDYLRPVFDEIVGIGKEISTHGDIP